MTQNKNHVIMGIFSRLFKKECQHDWQIEQPTLDLGGLMVWEGPVKDICAKCGATRPHPENDNEVPK